MQFDVLSSRIRNAFLHNLVPGVFLWIVAISITLAYYHLPQAGQLFSAIGELKARYGLLYSASATALFGGLIPFLYFVVTRQTGSNAGSEALFYTLFCALKGIEVDLFYRFQGLVFGTDTAISTVVMKTIFDQFFYAPLWAVPSIAIAYLFKDNGFLLRPCLQQVDRTFITLIIPTIVISNLLVWLPAVSMIYLMPPELQVPLFNLVQCFFSLLLNMLGKRG